MKISVLTHPPMKNYGGILQAKALSAALEQLGHDVMILNGPYEKISGHKQIFNKFKCLIGLNKEKKYHQLKHFVQNQLPLSKIWHGKEMPDCDCIVVGSDQVWRPAYTHFPGAYFLDFVPTGKKLKRIAYAASFGVDNWEFTQEQTSEFGKLLKKFDAVSVRETSGIPLCREHWNVVAVQMPDPTLLHEWDFYQKIASAETCDYPEKSYVFTYFLDNTTQKAELAKSFAEKTGLTLYNFLSSNKKATLRPIEKFLNGISNAKFVLTDSFHGMVFSMLSGVPFAVAGNKKRGLTRFELMKNAGLSEALLNENQSLEQCLFLLKNTDYFATAKDFLIQERLRGRNFLKENL